MNNTDNSARGEFVFLMGLPAAGKSHVARQRYATTHTVLDPDAIKTEHPDYDPANAALVHDWSMDEMEKRFMSILTDARTGNFVLDGTGTNAEAMVRRMNLARAWGFSVTLLYVKCSLATSLRRAGLRERKVPVEIIRQKALTISTSFELCAPYADKIFAVNSDVDDPSLIPTQEK